MIVNGKDYKIDDMIKNIDFSSNNYQKVGSLILTKNEIAILTKNYIDYKSCTSLNDLRIRIESTLDDDFIDEDDLLELEYVLESISERNYYANVKK